MIAILRLFRVYNRQPGFARSIEPLVNTARSRIHRKLKHNANRFLGIFTLFRSGKYLYMKLIQNEDTHLSSPRRDEADIQLDCQIFGETVKAYLFG